MSLIYKIEVFANYDDSLYVNSVMYKECNDNTLLNEVIPSLVEKHKEEDEINIHHILATLCPTDVEFDEQYDFMRQYMFLGDGTLLVERQYENLMGESTFNGRDEKELKFNVGDVVNVAFGKHISFGVVCGLPPKVGEYKGLDSTDDSYTILEGLTEIPKEMDDDTYMEYHEHVEVINVFPFKKIDRD